jgi:hypothetical protein
MPAEAEKHMASEIDALFSLTLLIRDTVTLTTIDCFFWKISSVRWGAGLQGRNATKVMFIIHIFWYYASCILDTLKL